MKFACRSEMTAPPIRRPFRPQSSISRPAPGPPAGFLKTLPNVRFVVGWVAFRCASSALISALISSTGRGASRKLTSATTSPGRERRVPVGEPELGRSRRPARRRPRRRVPRPARPTSRCRRPRRSCGRRRRRCPGSRTRTRARRAPRRGPDAGRPRSRHRRRRPGRPLDAAPGRARPRAGGRGRRRRRRGRGGSSRGRPSRPRGPRRRPSASSSSSSSSVSGRAKQPRRPAGADRREARERHRLLERDQPHASPPSCSQERRSRVHVARAGHEQRRRRAAPARARYAAACGDVGNQPGTPAAIGERVDDQLAAHAGDSAAHGPGRSR